MAILDLFSSRKKRATATEAEIFLYDEVPNALRVQIVHIWEDAFGQPDLYLSQTRELYELMHRTLCREFGLFSLGKHYEDAHTALANYFLKLDNVDRVLDIIEFTFQRIEDVCSKWQYREHSQPIVTAAQAIQELNARFLAHAVGYEYVSGQIIRKDTEILHKEVVLPALILLQGKKFAGANQEYLSAHEHYRRGKYKESLNDCLKAFESTMKVICEKKGWHHDSKATAKALIEVCFKNNLIPGYLQSEISSLRTALEAGIPTVRNRLGGHGQGSSPVEVPDYYAAYLLHLTAANILFLANAAQM